MLTLRDPVHGFIRADPLEAALISSRPLQRLRFIHQLGMSFLVFPGAEHSRFSHVLGAMHLAGRVYDRLAEAGEADENEGLLPRHPGSPERRLVRAAALLHDLGHAPFSHSAEELFEGGIDHEEMTLRLLRLPEVEEIFERHGDGLRPERVAALLAGGSGDVDRLLYQIVSGDLDVDKMDYLLRDSLFCGVQYGRYDLDRLLDTMVPLVDPVTGEAGIGIEEGGVHALEGLVMARYYMFTQVYFNVTGKAMELHLNEWLLEQGLCWPSDPREFLRHDDVTTLSAMRASDSLHAAGVVDRNHFPLAYETREHLSDEERVRFEGIVDALEERFGAAHLMISHSAKDPHRLPESRVLARHRDGRLEPVAEASHFIRHLGRIERFRVYCPEELRDEVTEFIRRSWGG